MVGTSDAYGDPHTDLEQQAVVEVTQLGIASQMKRKERHLLFALSRPLTRAQATWLKEARENRRATSNE